MTDSQNKKTNWLAVISVLLALILIMQTGILMHVLKKKDSGIYKTDRLISNPLVSSPGQTSISPTAHSSSVNSMRPRRHATPNYYNQDPSDAFEALQDDMARMMSGFMSGFPSMMGAMNSHMGFESMPHIDLQEKNNAYIVRMDVPGLDKDKIEISVKGETLTVQGIRETVNQEENASYFTQERSYGSFSRSLRLPGPVDDVNVKANYEKGVLTITLPKAKPDQASKKISIA